MYDKNEQLITLNCSKHVEGIDNIAEPMDPPPRFSMLMFNVNSLIFVRKKML